MKPILGITIGDPAGIGPEVALKALDKESIYSSSIPILIGDALPILKTAKILGIPEANLIEIAKPEDAKGLYGTIEYIKLGILKEDYEVGKVSKNTGEAAFCYVTKAIELALENKIAAIVTAPINKEAIHLAGHNFPGHTEILAHYCNVEDFAMVLVSGNLRVIHVTTHVSMKEMCETLSEERVYETIKLAFEAQRSMALTGKIAVAALNPHASENSLFGDEEAKYIKPAINRAASEGLDIEGPIPADTVFAKALGGSYSMVVAMYHDQGHIPVKLAGFKFDEKTGTFSEVGGINCTIGLPIIRTSVDHGTAFDLAGKGIANEQSMIDAIELAATMAEKREIVYED